MSKPEHSWDEVRPYEIGDLGHVWADLRDDDRRELLDGGFQDAAVIEQMLLTETVRVLTWDTNDGPVAIIGVTRTDDPAVGLVWAIASKSAEPRWRFAVRNTQSLLREIGEGFMVLANFKDSRNQHQIKWLKKIGFTFINTHQGLDGLTYLEFVRIMK